MGANAPGWGRTPPQAEQPAGCQPLLLRELSGTAYRLIGVGVSGFAPMAEADPFDLADPDAPRRAKLEDAVDDLRDRFGTAVIGKGRGLKH